MINLKIKLFGFLMVLCSISFVACSDEDANVELESVENFVDGSIQGLQDGIGAGRKGCVEFVFPISIVFVDESTIEVADYEELHDQIKAWKEANVDNENRKDEKPQLVFPIDVINQDGEVINVEAKENLKEIYKECGGRFGKWKHGKRGHKGRGYSCYSPVFPVSIEFPDGTVEAFEDGKSIHKAMHQYIRENGRDAERPTLVFPITVVDEDDNETVVNNKEELVALKETCSDEG